MTTDASHVPRLDLCPASAPPAAPPPHRLRLGPEVPQCGAGGGGELALACGASDCSWARALGAARGAPHARARKARLRPHPLTLERVGGGTVRTRGRPSEPEASPCVTPEKAPGAQNCSQRGEKWERAKRDREAVVASAKAEKHE